MRFSPTSSAFTRKKLSRQIDMNSLSLTLPTNFEEITVLNPFDGSVIGQVAKVPATSVHVVIDAALHGAGIARNLSRAERSRILEQTAILVEKDKDDFAKLISAESGKNIRQARK